MNPAQLLAHFDRISEAPDAIPRLRRFILDLAVRGKLVEQDPNDEPAVKLLKRIQAEKVRLVQKRAIRKQSEPSSLNPTVLPFFIPSHWEWIQICRIGVLSGGMTPSKNRSDFWEGAINWFSPKDIKSDELTDSELKISTAGLSETGLQLYPPGCLFMVARSGILKRTFPVAINRVAATANQDLKVLCPFLQGMERYIQIMLQGMTNFILTTLVKTGTTVQSLKYEEFEVQIVPIPPLAEQHRIVAKVDELMALCDQLEAAKAERESHRDRLINASLHRLNSSTDADASREQARFYLNQLPHLTTRPEHIKQLRQTILNLAVRGRLVPQDPNDEPVAELLKKIRVEKERLLKGRENIAIEFKASSTPFPIPRNWIWVYFGQIMISRDSERIPISKEERNKRKKIYDYYGASGIIDKIDDYLFDKSLLLIGEDGANLINRSTPIAFIARGRYWVNNHAHVLDGISEEFLRFMEMYINATDLRPYVTGTAQPKMNQAKMNSIPIALPPENEQHRIVAKVDELMALCDQLEAQLTTTQTDSRRLLEAILHQALVENS